MNYLFTAAGRGSRFKTKGLKPPKPLLKVFGNELLIWSMNSFNFNYDDRIFIVTYKFHKVKERLDKKIRIIFPDIPIFWLELESIPKGQLLTAKEAITFFNIKGSVLIHNCDTSYKFNMEDLSSLLNDDLFGIIPCFQAEGDNWSFAKSSEKDSSIAIEVREKKRISKNCSVGTYFFTSTEKLILLVEEYLNINVNLNEYYIAPFYQYAIDKKLKVKIFNAKNVKVFGTPEELISNFGVTFEELLGENAWNGHQISSLVVDIDKTICDKKNCEDYSNAKPIIEVCEALRKANDQGVYIILFTSRNMRSFGGSIGLINKITAPILFKWLNEYQIPFDEIYFGKPWGNSVSYVDDKSLSIDNLIKKFEN